MNKGIVIQLQEEALDDNVNIETLLRKAFLVAHKLQLKEFENWINNEQNGYAGPIPDYRYIRGETKAFNRFNGWIPVIIDEEIDDVLNRRALSNPISFVSELYDSKKPVSFSVPSEITNTLNRWGSVDTYYCFFSSRSELHRVISAIRNKVLEWSLLLEGNGIVGENLRFTDEEIKTAKESPVINNYINNFYSSVINPNITQGD